MIYQIDSVIQDIFLMAALKFYLKRRNCRAYVFFARYLLLPFLHVFLYIFFLSGFSFTDTGDYKDSSGREGIILYSTLPLPATHGHSDICLQLCMWDDYHVFLISTLVFIGLLLDEIYHLIDCWCNVCLFTWWCESRFFVKAIWHG